MHSPLFRWFNSIIAISLVVILSANLKANEKGIYNITNYTPKQYSAHSQNWCAVQDHRGVMYFGNNIGVLEYDGTFWNLIKTTNESNVRSLLVHNSGKIYVGGKDELGYLFPDSSGTMIYHSLMSYLPDSAQSTGDIWSIHFYNDEVVFQSNEQLIFWNGESLRQFTFDFTVINAFANSNNLLLTAKTGELYRYQNNELKLVNQLLIDDEQRRIADILFEENKTFVLVIREGVYELLPGDSLALVKKIENEKIGKNVNNIIPLDDNTYGVGTWGFGLGTMNKFFDIEQIIDNNYGLQDLTINHQFVDNQKNLWLSLSNGITKIDINSPLSFLNNEQGLSGTIESITRHNGTLYMATSNGLAYLVPAEDGFSLPQIKYNPYVIGECWDVKSFQNKNYSTLLFIDNNALWELSSPEARPKKIAPCYPYSILQSKYDSNRVFIGNEPGLISIYHSARGWKNEGEVEGIEVVSRFLSEDDNGNLWIGSDRDGLLSVEFDFDSPELIAKNITKFGEDEGIKENWQVIQHWGEKWHLTGTYKGLFRYNSVKEKFEKDTVLTSSFPNLNHSVLRLSEDKNGNIWIVCVLENNSVEVSYATPPTSIRQMILKKAPFIDLSEYIIFAFQHDNDGTTWMGGPDGLFRYATAKEKNYRINFNTSIRSVSLANDSTLFGGTNFDSTSISLGQNNIFNNTLAYKNNSLTFSYAAHCYINETENLYSHYLEGFDANWSDWKPENKSVYTNLPEGTYYFHVKALNKYKHESSESVYEFTILPPWYRTWWAYIGYILLFIGVVKLAIEVSTKSLQAIIKEKTAEVVAQKDEIESKNATLENANEEILHQKHEIEEINKDIIDSINYAEKIQRAILPQKEMQERILTNSFVLFRPKDIVSGDFYWMNEKQGKSFFTAADCTGHGVPGAFMSMIGTSLLNETVNEQGVNTPAKILDNVKAGIIRSLKQGEEGESKDGMDAALCALNHDTNILEYAGGNNPLYIVRKGKAPLTDGTGTDLEVAPYLEDEQLVFYEIKADKFPIAYYPGADAPFTNHEIQLIEGDTIYISSDGFPDQFGGPKGKKFMYKKFKKYLMTINNEPIMDQGQILEDKIVEWMGDEHEQVDDICIIGVKI